MLLKLGKYLEAITYFDKSLSIKPNSVCATHKKGEALDDTGRHTEAIDYYNKAHYIIPKYSGERFNRVTLIEGKSSQSTYRSAL